MVKASVNRAVFTLYTGLIASGYDLTKLPAGDALTRIIKDVKAVPWHKDTLCYFSQARVPGMGVNPYWPRAAMLLNAGFHLSDGPVPDYEDRDTVLRNIRDFPVGASQKDESTVSWVMRYPRAYASLNAHPALSDVWNRFQEVMNDDRLRPFERVAGQAMSSLSSALGIAEDASPSLRIIVNPLQSPMIADFVRKDGGVIAVVAGPRMGSITHEMLHCVFEGALQTKRDVVLGYRDLFVPLLVDSMGRMQYAWDAGDESWLRVFEETLVRAASIWVSHRDDFGEAERIAQSEAQAGFIYVPAILRTFNSGWRGPDRIEPFIEACLLSCMR